MMNTKHHRILLVAILVLFSFCSYAVAESVIVLNQSVKPVGTVSSGRFVKIEWHADLKNTTPAPLTCEITLSFFNGEDKVISKATETQELGALQEKSVKGTVRVRTSIAQQIAATDISVVVE